MYCNQLQAAIISSKRGMMSRFRKGTKLPVKVGVHGGSNMRGQTNLRNRRGTFPNHVVTPSPHFLIALPKLLHIPSLILTLDSSGSIGI